MLCADQAEGENGPLSFPDHGRAQVSFVCASMMLTKWTEEKNKTLPAFLEPILGYSLTIVRNYNYNIVRIRK